MCLFELLPLSGILGRVFALSLSLGLLRKYVRTHFSSLTDKYGAPVLSAAATARGRGVGF